MSKKIKPKFVEFKTKDKLVLPGLLYGNKKDKAVVLFLHGNGSSSVFYNETKHHILASSLAEKNISILHFNNRGAHIIKTFKIKKGGVEERVPYGMSYEKIKECIIDIDGAIAFLKKRGYNKFYLAGHSTGANKICVYNFYKPKNNIEKYILLAGGDDTGIYYNLLGKNRFWKLLKKSKEKIKNKEGNEIMKETLPDYIFSYGGFFDIANPDGDYNVFPYYEILYKMKLSTKPLFRYFKSIKKPSLIIYGDQDEYTWGNVPKVINILKEYQPKLDYKIIKNADHGFNKKEKILAKIITNWL